MKQVTLTLKQWQHCRQQLDNNTTLSPDEFDDQHLGLLLVDTYGVDSLVFDVVDDKLWAYARLRYNI